jgi:hypothetical protein
MTRQELFNAMATQRTMAYKGHNYRILGIEMEDGSGYCFNVKLTRQDPNFRGMITATAFVRCRKEYNHIPA